jgi:hypothetical protein
MSVEIPKAMTCFAPSCFSCSSRSVPMKAELTVLVMSGSFPVGPKPGLKVLPGPPRRKSRVRLNRVMPDVDDRTLRRATQLATRGRSRRRHDSSGTAMAEQRLLHVDRKKDSVVDI